MGERLGIVSDTHGHLQYTQNAIRMLESLEVDRVLHCGDIGTAEVVKQFAPWPTYFVFGNCDYDHESLRQAITAQGSICCDEFASLTIDGVRIALLHSHDRQRFQHALNSGEYDLVCYGHTHVAAVDRHGETVAVNPGAIYRASPHSLAIVELPEIAPQIIAI